MIFKNLFYILIPLGTITLGIHFFSLYQIFKYRKIPSSEFNDRVKKMDKFSKIFQVITLIFMGFMYYVYYNKG